MRKFQLEASRVDRLEGLVNDEQQKLSKFCHSQLHSDKIQKSVQSCVKAREKLEIPSNQNKNIVPKFVKTVPRRMQIHYWQYVVDM